MSFKKLVEEAHKISEKRELFEDMPGYGGMKSGDWGEMRSYLEGYRDCKAGKPNKYAKTIAKMKFS